MYIQELIKGEVSVYVYENNKILEAIDLLEGKEKNNEGNQKNEHHVHWNARLAGSGDLKGMQLLKVLPCRHLHHHRLCPREGQRKDALGGIATRPQRFTDVVNGSLEVKFESYFVFLVAVVRREDEIEIVGRVDGEGPHVGRGGVVGGHVALPVYVGCEVDHEYSVTALFHKLFAARVGRFTRVDQQGVVDFLQNVKFFV